jgi:phosphoribosylglycinamide formyltransferase-1
MRILNIHPALLPAFPGLEAQHQAWEYGVKISGCSVHFVDEELDHGPIIYQISVPVQDTDDADALSHRILEQEHKAYPAALKLICEDRIEVVGRRVIVKDRSEKR